MDVTENVSEINQQAPPIIALICDDKGIIQKIIRCEINLASPPEIGRSWISIIDPGSLMKAFNFMSLLRLQQAVSGWEINLQLASGLMNMHFMGGQVGNELLIVGSSSLQASERVYVSELLLMNNQQVNMLRSMTKEQVEFRRRAEDDMRYYEELSRLNNELVTLQRDLAQKNRELEENQRLLKKMIETSPSPMYIYDLTLNRATFINKRVQGVLGYSPEWFSNSDALNTIIHPDDVGIYQKFLEYCKAAKDDEVITEEFRVCDILGHWHWLIVRSTVFNRDVAGMPIQFLNTAQDISDSKEVQQKLYILSTRDSLTGLNNRAFFENELERMEVDNDAYPICIFIADVDGLKYINDTEGHNAGDALIRSAAEFLRHSFRAQDIVARLGGDEFGVLLPQTDAHRAEEILVRIRNNMGVAHQKDTPHPVRFSIGYAVAALGQKLSDVLRQADHQMYIDKNLRRVQRHDVKSRVEDSQD